MSFKIIGLPDADYTGTHDSTTIIGRFSFPDFSFQNSFSAQYFFP